MNIDLLEKIVNDQAESFSRKERGLVRDIDYGKQLKTKQITVITGIRRSGKSVLLSQFSDHYKKYHYVNFDDERLIGFGVGDFDLLMTVFLKRSNAKVLFVDEIQNIENWERFVRRVFDEGYKLFITGSNAKLLSSELATHLTGRYFKIDLYPFSFKEVLDLKNIDVGKKSTANEVKISKALDKYLVKGGFPDYVRFDDEEFLKNVYENVLFRDLIARFGIREVKVFRELASYLFSNFTSKISYNGLRNILGMKNVSSLRSYIGYMEESYLLFELYKYDFSMKKQYTSEKKIYAIDNGLRNAVAFYFSEDRGRLLENMVFLELKRRALEIYFYKDKGECDFIIRRKNKIVGAVQVCFEISADNRAREIGGLIEAMEKFGLRKGEIVTYGQSEEILQVGFEISLVPVSKWLTEGFYFEG